jgi:anti-anti-sigma factor
VSRNPDHGEPVNAADTVNRPESPDRSGARGAYWLVVSRGSDAVVVNLHGALDGRASVRLGAILTDLIVGQGNLAVTVDLRDLGPVDAACVEVFAAAASAVDARGGALALIGPPDEIVATVRSAGLARLISGNAEHRGTRPGPRVATSRARHPAGGAFRPNDLEVLV